MRWYKWRLTQRCNWCINSFFNKASGISATFCHYKNWNDQIVKRFSTGKNDGSRDKIICPINTYASGFQGKYGIESEERLGFHGILLRCTTPDYKGSQNI